MIPSQAASRSFALRKLVLSFGLIIISAVYAVWQSVNGVQSALMAATQSTPGQSYKAANDALLQTLAQINNATPTPTKNQTVPTSKSTSKSVAPAPAPTPAPTPTPQKPAGQYTDGSYTGSPADAYYGTVQVEAVIQNGQLADVKFLQYPDTHSTSVYINQQAMPMLTQEAIQAQSANVDGVSGATFTSQAFAQSLASALTKAKA
ncbi:MAG: FMN-binding protein [Minisyncoccota bacterium]